MVTALLHQVRAGELTQLDGLQALLEAWPYSDVPWWPNEDQTPDVCDRGRFVLGLLLALNSAVEPAQREIERIVASPATADSRWVAPTRAFLAAYSNAADLPDACRAAAVCADLLEPADLVRIAALDESNHPAGLLRDLGLPVRATGEQDLDGDGDRDAWLTLGDGVERASIWLFFSDGGRRFPVQANSAPANGQVTFAAPPPDEQGLIVSPVTDEGVQRWRLVPSDTTGSPELLDLCYELASAARAASLRLITWDAEAPTADDLAAMDAHVKALCPGRTNIHGDYDDAALRYAVALASERSGDDCLGSAKAGQSSPVLIPTLSA